MKISVFFKSVSKSLILLTFFTPFIVSTFSVFPFVYGKTVFFNTLIQFSLIFFLLHLLFDFENTCAEIKARFSGKRNWVLLAALFFLLSIVVSTIFAEVPYIAFWGNVDRNEGLVAFLYSGVFILLSYILFNKSDWYLYYCGLLISVVLLCVVAWMQYLGIEANIIMRISHKSQPGSFAGNPVFLSSFLTAFLLYTSALFDFSDFRKRPILFSMIGLLVISTILLTGIRGELLGLISAAIILIIYGVFKCSNKKIKFFAVGCMIGLSVLVGTFLVTKSNPFWHKIPTINRFATLSSQSNSYVARMYTWEAALKGFKEKWLFGWGAEGFNIVFNKYGSGKIAEYSDDWFDRAHNKLLDIMIYQGIIGVVTFFFLFGVLIYTFRKKVFFISFFAAYFVQSLFIFDTNLTYLVISVIIAFAAQNYVDLGRNEEKQLVPVHFAGWQKNIIKTASILAIPAIILFFVLFTITSVKQQLLFGKVMKLPRFEDRAVLLHDLFYPFGPAQPRVRMFVNQALRDWMTINRPGGIDAILLGVDALKEVLKYDPLEVRYHMRLTEAYLELGAFDKKYYALAEQYGRLGIQLAPRQHKLYYLLTFVLSKQARYDDAIDMAKRAVEIDPNVARSNLYLSLTEFAAADPNVNPYYDPGDPKYKKYLKDAVATLSKTLDLAETKSNGEKIKDASEAGSTQYALLEMSDYNNLILLLTRMGDYKKLIEIAEIGLVRSQHSQVMYQYILSYYIHQKDSAKTLRVLSRMKGAPFAWQLPIAEWEEYAKQSKWDELKKHEFIGKFIVIYNIPPIEIPAE